MNTQTLSLHSLVRYKVYPAQVVSMGDAPGDKIEIKLPGGACKRVRAKDITLLHPGPLHFVDDLGPLPGDVEDAWALLEGADTDLAELSELVFANFTPQTAWATWLLVSDGLHFFGSSEQIQLRSKADIEQLQTQRAQKIKTEQDFSALIARLQQGKVLAQDHKMLSEVEMLARGLTPKSRIMRALSKKEAPQQAHELLLKIGLWDGWQNPYPARYSISLKPPTANWPQLPDEKRLDLTHLFSFAIDDEGSQDPDDAISVDGERIWVHVADVAAVITADSELDILARSRGTSHYLPESTVAMLPQQAVLNLGLGLNDVSPALSFAFNMDANGQLSGLAIEPSWIKVTRLSYQEAELLLTQPHPLKQLKQFADIFKARRQQQGAYFLNLPDVSIKVKQQDIRIQPIEHYSSHDLVAELMLMAGNVVASFACEHNIPLPFVGQEASQADTQAITLAEMFDCRKKLKRSRALNRPEPHGGLGLACYARVTSPLRRYLDLLTHQQLRAYKAKQTLLSLEQITHRIGAIESLTEEARKVERLSKLHWTLTYLMAQPDWLGEGVIVELGPKKATLFIPSLALQTTVFADAQMALNQVCQYRLERLDLPQLTVHFKLVQAV